MRDFDKRKLNDELAEAFIQYQYNLEYPLESHLKSKDEMIAHYMSDGFFHRKVQALTGGVMRIVIDNLEQGV